MTEQEKAVEVGARRLCAREGIDPDAMLAPPQTAVSPKDARPAWTYFVDSMTAAVSAIAADGYEIRRPPRAGDDLGNGLVAVPASSIDAVFAAQDRFEADCPNQAADPDPVTVAIRSLRAMLAAAKEG